MTIALCHPLRVSVCAYTVQLCHCVLESRRIEHQEKREVIREEEKRRSGEEPQSLSAYNNNSRAHFFGPSTVQVTPTEAITKLFYWSLSDRLTSEERALAALLFSVSRSLVL